MTTPPTPEDKKKCECVPQHFPHLSGKFKGNCGRCDKPRRVYEKDPTGADFYQSLIDFIAKKDRELK